MAAVAGSKGRIALLKGSTPTPSFQATLAGRLLDRTITVGDVTRSLTSAAQLREVGVDTNMICNLACKYCYLDDRPEAKGLIEAIEWKSYLEPLIDAGCKLVAFIGKEPLADTIALDTISALNEKRDQNHKFRIGMVTNGTLLDRRIDRLQSARLDYLDISLDSLPEINDPMRGDGVFERVVKNIKIYLTTAPAHDFSITSVLHKDSVSRYIDFVDFIFSIGIKTAFGSPVLRFTERDTAAPVAISVENLSSLLDKLGIYLSRLSPEARNERQVIIDLPYKYSWLFLKTQGVDWADIMQDAYEAHYLQPDPSIPLFVKFNFFPMSYWKAIRVTHDARVIENMDLAAHRLYSQHTRHCSDREARWYLGQRQWYHDKFLFDFVSQHADLSHISKELHDREVEGQMLHLNSSVEAGAYV